MVGPAISAAAVVDASAATPVGVSACLGLSSMAGLAGTRLPLPSFFSFNLIFHHCYSLVSYRRTNTASFESPFAGAIVSRPCMKHLFDLAPVVVLDTQSVLVAGKAARE
jgi:hypothetical protein